MKVEDSTLYSEHTIPISVRYIGEKDENGIVNVKKILSYDLMSFEMNIFILENRKKKLDLIYGHT